MNKKIIGILISIVIVIGGYLLISKRPAPLEIDPNENSGQATTTEEVSTTTVKTPESEASLKTKALSILNRSIQVTATLPAGSEKEIRAKIETTITRLKADFRSVPNWLDLGTYRRLIGDNQGALQAWQFILELDSKNYVALHNIGDLYAFSIRDYTEGEEYLLRSIEANSSNIQGYLVLAALYQIPSFGKGDKVENVFLEGIRVNPKDVALLVAFAEYYRDHGNKAKAIEYFKKALALDPPNRALIEAKLREVESGI